MSLQSQDLVWVDGKSTSWRNPGEITELCGLLASSARLDPDRTGCLSDKSSASRITCEVRLPDHSLAVDQDPWPPTLSYHLYKPGSEPFWGDAGTDSPFSMSFHDHPVVIGNGVYGEGGMITVRLIREPGYSGKGRREKKSDAYRLTPVFERSGDTDKADSKQETGTVTKIPLEFLSD